MKEIKSLLIGCYVVIALMVGIYGDIWGTYAYKGFAYNLGRGFFWPVLLVPSLGHVIAAVIIIAILSLIVIFGKKG